MWNLIWKACNVIWKYFPQIMKFAMPFIVEYLKSINEKQKTENPSSLRQAIQFDHLDSDHQRIIADFFLGSILSGVVGSVLPAITGGIGKGAKKAKTETTEVRGAVREVSKAKKEATSDIKSILNELLSLKAELRELKGGKL